MLRAVKIRLYPNKTQATQFNKLDIVINFDKIQQSFPEHKFRLVGNEEDDSVDLYVDGKYAFSLDEESFIGTIQEDYELIYELVEEHI